MLERLFLISLCSNDYLVNELRFSAYPFDEWFRFHCCKFRTFRILFSNPTTKLQKNSHFCKPLAIFFADAGKKVRISTETGCPWVECGARTAQCADRQSAAAENLGLRALTSADFVYR